MTRIHLFYTHIAIRANYLFTFSFLTHVDHLGQHERLPAADHFSKRLPHRFRLLRPRGHHRRPLPRLPRLTPRPHRRPPLRIKLYTYAC